MPADNERIMAEALERRTEVLREPQILQGRDAIERNATLKGVLHAVGNAIKRGELPMQTIAMDDVVEYRVALERMLGDLI